MDQGKAETEQMHLRASMDTEGIETRAYLIPSIFQVIFPITTGS